MIAVRRSVLLSLLLVVLVAPAARAATPLARALDEQLSRAGTASGALVEDADTGRNLYDRRADDGRLPASVEKLWTTSAALDEFGEDRTFPTTVLATGRLGRGGVLRGSLYLRGGGDPTFGPAAAGRLVARLRALGVKRVAGRVIGDEGLFDMRRGVPSTGYGFSPDVEPLSALSYDRNTYRGYYVRAPARNAAAALTIVLRARGVRVDGDAGIGRTPSGADRLAEVRSPPVGALLAATNAPSDNFYAETLLKDLGARAGAGGTTAAGAGVARRDAARRGLHPTIYDGAGLSRGDLTSPLQAVTLLRERRDDPVFTRSLAVAGRTGTLEDRLRNPSARGRCRGKTGTLRDVSNLVGYCTTRSGRRIVFAIMMNRVYSIYGAHILQDRMVLAIMRYAG